MVGRCPYLGLAGSRQRVFSVSSSRHRCYLRDDAERIGDAFQGTVCLTSGYRRCPRLVAGAPSSERQAASRRLQIPQVKPSSLAASGEGSVLPGSWTRRPVPYTELRALVAVKKPKPRRRTSATELLALGLGAAIVVAVLFVGIVLVSRLRVGPGMGADFPAVAEPERVVAQVPSTQVPTFTPTASPTPVPPVAPTGSPTPIPEPTLPVPTAVARPPADSPPTRLVIPKIDVDIPVLPVGTKTIRERGKPKLVWADVPNAGGFHQTSAYPGNAGNTVINGHRDILGAVFRRLDRVEMGDEIVLYVGDIAYPYRVTQTLVVPSTFASAAQRAENLELIGYMPEERLTLITCTPVRLATHRLLVIAKPPDRLVPQMPEAGSDAEP
jgi:LPXTG-site transpeptidase (sortase) family protein